MSNKKKISKKRKQLDILSLKRNYFITLFKLRIENAMLRSQIQIISSQPKKEYPSGGNIGFIKPDNSYEKIENKQEWLSLAKEIPLFRKHQADALKYYKPDQNPVNELHGLDYSNLKSHNRKN